MPASSHAPTTPAPLASITTPTERELLISLVDLTLFARTVRGMPDLAMSRMCQEFYERVGDIVARSSGTLVKFMGDAALIAWPRECAEEGILALLEMKRSVDDWMGSLGHPCRLVVRAHCGKAVAGPFGTRDARRFDILGNDVNLTAMLESRGFALTAEAFRTLSPESRHAFKKHTPPITYIPTDQRH